MKKYLARKLIRWGMLLLKLPEPKNITCSECGSTHTERTLDAGYDSTIGFYIVTNPHWYLSTLCFDCEAKVYE